MKRTKVLKKSKEIMVITGAGGFIGGRLAQRAKAAGYEVIGIDQQKTIRKLTQLKKKKYLDHYFTGDISSPNTFETFNKTDLSQKKISVLINCAGGSGNAFSGLGNFENFHLLISSNLYTAWNACSYFVPKMIISGGGRIVNFSSAMATIGSTNGTAYCTAKASILGFSYHLAIFGAPHNILVNSVSPSHIEGSPRHHSFFKSPAGKAFIQNKMPMKKLCSTKDICDSVLFLASSENKAITGQNFMVDGGMSLLGIG